MDFSSPDRALESLPRRQPALEEATVEISTRLLSLTNEMKEGNAVIVKDDILSLMTEETTLRWEGLAVGLFLATELLQHRLDNKLPIYVDGPRVPSIKDDTAAPSEMSSNTVNIPPLSVLSAASFLSLDDLMKICKTLMAACSRHLEHTEPRVRTLVAKGIGAVVAFRRFSDDDELRAATQGLHDMILNSLRDHLEKGRDEETDKYSKSSTGALDDTTGWRALETNWQGFAAYIAACGGQYFVEHELTDQLLQDCEYSAATHRNRHVRAAACNVLEQMVRAASDKSTGGDAATLELVLGRDSKLRKTVVSVVKVGLADNWSQVRMAASVLCRTFWMILLENEAPVEDLYPAILPHMCLNRFYLAQGVKLYSHETWHLIFVKQGSGLDQVAAHAGAVCRYYVKMCDADNHAVREAACQAIAELATKVGANPKYQSALQPFVPLLMQALLMCFHDESWPVRDEACLACGLFCKAYPAESKSELPTLWQRWTEQLTDHIWSVREDAAVALSDALVAHPEELYPKIIEFLRTTIPSAKSQVSMTMEEYKKSQNDVESHTDSTLYSCGSLAPKLRKGGAGRIGCSSCGVNRPKAPWEATDGCIYMLRELCILSASPEMPAQVDLSDKVLMPLLTELADVCRVQHFPQSHELRATLWHQLTPMAYALGKERFKRLYLDIFIELLMSNLESRTATALSKHAAGQCAEELANLVGVGIFRGRIQDDFQREIFDSTMEERKRERAMAGPGDSFSPFGPSGLLDHVGKVVMASP